MMDMHTTQKTHNVLHRIQALIEKNRQDLHLQSLQTNSTSQTALNRSFDKYVQNGDGREVRITPFDRLQQCRDALVKLDKKGWNRSFHQRLFHEDFLVS